MQQKLSTLRLVRGKAAILAPGIRTVVRFSISSNTPHTDFALAIKDLYEEKRAPRFTLTILNPQFELKKKEITLKGVLYQWSRKGREGEERYTCTFPISNKVLCFENDGRWVIFCRKLLATIMAATFEVAPEGVVIEIKEFNVKKVLYTPEV